MTNEHKYLIGRQPILNRDEQVCAYELLFRSAGSLNSAAVSDASQATASVILKAIWNLVWVWFKCQHKLQLNKMELTVGIA